MIVPLDQCLIWLIFFISGIRLNLSHLWEERVTSTILLPSITAQFVLAPFCGFWLGVLLSLPDAWFIGLAAICCAPTTLSSGVVLTRQAEGNELLALLLTLTLTLIGSLISPALFGLLLGVGVSISLPITSLVIKLFILVLIPLALGQFARKVFFRNPPEYLKHLPSICVILTVWLATHTNTESLTKLPWYAWIAFPSFSLTLHGLWFAALWQFGKIAELHYRIRIALSIVGSQKTLPLALTLLTAGFAGSPLAGELSAAIAFVVVFHLTQILLDSILAPYLAENHQ